MNRLLLLSAIVLPVVPITSCALDDGASPSGLGGSAPSGSGGHVATSGASSTSGGVGSGSGGTAAASGGASSSGGSSSMSGGTTASMQGGASGSSAQGGSSAGMGTAQGGAAQGGGTPMNGGMPGSGGAAGGSAGMTSTGSGGAGAGAPGLGEIVGKMDGYLGMYPCGAGDFTGYDCINTSCTNGSKRVQQDFTIGGSASTVYEIELRVRGLVEAKNYTSACMRRAGSTMDSSTMGGDFLCTGGATQNSSYNEYSLTVTAGQVTGEPTFYGLNSRNGTGEAHESWALNYTFKFRVHGGGTVRYTYFDSNCRMITNCGPGVGGSTCGSDQRVLDVSNADPQPTTLMQPYLGVPQANGPGQWILLDVLSATAMQ